MLLEGDALLLLLFSSGGAACDGDSEPSNKPAGIKTPVPAQCRSIAGTVSNNRQKRAEKFSPKVDH